MLCTLPVTLLRQVDLEDSSFLVILTDKWTR